MSSIIERIEREAGINGLVDLLAERLSPTDLQSLLLEVYRRRASRRSPVDVLADYTNNRFVHPARVAPRRLTEWESLIWSLLPPLFEPVTLSPVAPLGTNSVVATVDQNKVVSTIRNTEVLSDATNVLALECALRRRRLLQTAPKSTEEVHLAASHRLLRPQFVANPNMLPHFSLFGLCSAGRGRQAHAFEIGTIRLHARFYLSLLQAFLGPETAIEFRLTDFAGDARRDLLEESLLSPLRDDFPSISCRFAPERTTGRGYYQELCFHIYATLPDGSESQLADGGAVDWAQQYLCSARERLVISGIGSERVILMRPL